jgi:Holliday junction resolvase
MQPRSAQNKGKRAEKEVCRRIERAGLGAARREAGSGNGIKKGDVFANLPFLLEVKNQKTVHLQDWIKQSKEQSRIGNSDPNKWGLIIVSPDGIQDPERMDMTITVELDEFLELLKRNQEPKIKIPDRNLAYKLNKLRQISKEVLNEL